MKDTDTERTNISRGIATGIMKKQLGLKKSQRLYKTKKNGRHGT